MNRMHGSNHTTRELEGWMEFVELLERLEVYRPGVNSFVWLLRPDDEDLYKES